MDLPQTVFHRVFAPVHERLKGLAAVSLDVIVRILLAQRSVLPPLLRQAEHLHLQVGAAQQGQGPLGSVLSRRIIIQTQYQLLGIPADQPDMLFRQSSTHGGHGVVKARLVHGNDVDVALHQNEVGPFAAFGVVDAI